MLVVTQAAHAAKHELDFDLLKEHGGFHAGHLARESFDSIPYP